MDIYIFENMGSKAARFEFAQGSLEKTGGHPYPIGPVRHALRNHQPLHFAFTVHLEIKQIDARTQFGDVDGGISFLYVG